MGQSKQDSSTEDRQSLPEEALEQGLDHAAVVELLQKRVVVEEEKDFPEGEQLDADVGLAGEIGDAPAPQAIQAGEQARTGEVVGANRRDGLLCVELRWNVFPHLRR